MRERGCIRGLCIDHKQETQGTQPQWRREQKTDRNRDRKAASQPGLYDHYGHERSKGCGYSKWDRDRDHRSSQHSLEVRGARKDQRCPRMEHALRTVYLSEMLIYPNLIAQVQHTRTSWFLSLWIQSPSDKPDATIEEVGGWVSLTGTCVTNRTPLLKNPLKSASIADTTCVILKRLRLLGMRTVI